MIDFAFRAIFASLFCSWKFLEVIIALGLIAAVSWLIISGASEI